MELFDNTLPPGIVRTALFSAGSKTKVVDTLPPTGTPGQTIIVQNGGNFYYYIWNSVTNSWVLIVNNSYITHYNGDDWDTDINGPKTWTYFDDKNWWTGYEMSPIIQHQFLGGSVQFETPGPAVAQNARFMSAVICRKQLWPTRAGLIDIEFWVDNYGDQLQIDATHGFDVAAYIQSNSISSNGVETIWCGARRVNGVANGEYMVKLVRPSLDGSETLRANVAPGTSITSFKMRFQWTVYLNGVTWVFGLDQPNVSYQHNSVGAWANIGGAVAAGYTNTCVPHRGLVFGLASKINNYPFNAKTFGRITRAILYSGRLISV